MDFTITIIILAFIQGLHAIGDNRCMDGWLQFRNACYWFSREKGSWAEAVVFCKAINSELADIQSEEENNFLAVEAANIHRFTSPVHYWVAGTDTIIENTWIWVTTGQKISFSHWGPGEPNGGGGSNCLGLLDIENYQWNDAPCSSIFPFICKQSLNENAPVIG